MDYTPTTEQLISWLSEHATAGDIVAAQRWISARDREVAARAWAEGAQWAAVELGEIRQVENQWVTNSDNPYRDTPKGD